MINASTPCTKSRWSYSNRAVASDGAPSVNSNVPRRLSTHSGVEIDANVSAESPCRFVAPLTAVNLHHLRRASERQRGHHPARARGRRHADSVKHPSAHAVAVAVRGFHAMYVMRGCLICRYIGGAWSQSDRLLDASATAQRPGDVARTERRRMG